MSRSARPGLESQPASFPGDYSTWLNCPGREDITSAKSELRDLDRGHSPSLSPVAGFHVAGDACSFHVGADVVGVSGFQDDFGVEPG